MNFVAIRMLVGDRLKYIALVAGIAFAALLITQQAAIFTGYTLRTGGWIRDTRQADLWVTDSQVELSDDFKAMSDTALLQVRGIEGVAWAVPLYKNYTTARLPDGTKVQVRVIGLDDATLVGLPPTLVTGQAEDLRRDRAVFVNTEAMDGLLRLKRAEGGGRALKLGDRIDINDNEVEVVGTYNASKEFFWDPVIYMTYSRAIRITPPQRKKNTFILVKLAPGASAEQVAARIQESTGLLARTNAQFERDTAWYILEKTGILVNFGITILLGFVIGLLVAGQTFFTFVLDNLRHFAALKAMGTGTATVIRMMLAQVLVVGLVGYGIGVGGASLSGLFLSGADLAFEMPWQIPVVGALAVLVCCAFAGGLGIIRVLHVEPGIVFKS